LLDKREIAARSYATSEVVTAVSVVERTRPLAVPKSEIGGALDSVLSRSDTRDLLLITDGKSCHWKFRCWPATACCIAVVLVGDDSPEADVGHLAALSGREIFVATGTGIDLAVAIESAINRLTPPTPRTRRQPPTTGALCGPGCGSSWRNDALRTMAGRRHRRNRPGLCARRRGDRDRLRRRPDLRPTMRAVLPGGRGACDETGWSGRSALKVRR